MDYLSRSLETIIRRVQASPALDCIPLKSSADFMPYQPLLNHYLVQTAFLSVDKTPFCRIHNDAAAAFYGLPDPDVTPLNISFYYRFIRVKHYAVMLQGHQFFRRNEKGEFRCLVDLKNAQGEFQPVKAAFRTVAWNDKGQAAYAIVVGSPVEELLYQEAYETLDLAGLPARTLQATKLLLQGHSNQEIADHLACSPKSVERDLHVLFQHAGLRNRKELFARLAPQDEATSPLSPNNRDLWD
ncbi:helix-turn-helix domain-containing protein [Roseibacillus ishigakijimensis]|uniref:Helix-turn-helix transcriptional regulator n=1 Tax=Roseibacillus ishigakijimensis TaxID=454146 RepID=A0A934RJI3_9BACT|nr:helix-turn-helix transcriptional regulator [Roseibacillus ishigakijimensis]MBK1832822.1 helix-turn-helix transcriptional regulator [Roseibacillus ishigakijimensis]